MASEKFAIAVSMPESLMVNEHDEAPRLGAQVDFRSQPWVRTFDTEQPFFARFDGDFFLPGELQLFQWQVRAPASPGVKLSPTP